MSPTELFGTIHESHFTISVNFYFYLQYFQQKVFNFSKISGSQTLTFTTRHICIQVFQIGEAKQNLIKNRVLKSYLETIVFTFCFLAVFPKFQFLISYTIYVYLSIYYMLCFFHFNVYGVLFFP